MESWSHTEKMVDTPVLSATRINYYQDQIHVLKDVDVKIAPGEFHAVIGDHGSGKSAIGMIFAGILQPSSGTIRYGDQDYNHFRLNQAKRLGIEMICQEVQLIQYFTIAENILVPDKLFTGFPFFRRQSLNGTAEKFLKKCRFDIDPTTVLENLPLSEKMATYILRGIYRKPELFILDAALEKLSPIHRDKIIRLILKMKSEGKAILCLTNSIDEVYDLADTISILRNGTIILTDSAVNLDKINLIKLCYSQMEEEDLSDQFREFYQLLQYNEAILQKLPINLIVTDDNNIIRMVNDHGKSYFHLEESSYRGLPLRDLFIDKNIETYQNITTAFLTKQERMLYHVPLIIGDQEAITNIKILPIYDGTTLIGNITIIEDITRQENYRQQVILSEKLASVGILAAGVAHEINNPLEIIYNHLNYMKFKPDREKVDEAIANIEEELGDISQIISNLISFSDSSKMSSEIFDLNDLTANLINLIKFNAKTRQIKIEFFPFSQPIYLNINKNEMKQVILNLMKNSFEASQEDGSISIKTSIEKRGLENVALFIFDDDGSGIVVENMDNIFLPFFSTKSANQNNLGLGLSVSYGIIKKYNGRITAENLQSGGCRFSIQIPVHQD